MKRFLILIPIILFTASSMLADYHVGAGDVLDIKIFEDPDASGTFEVSPDGFINFPYIGRIKVEGKTTSQIENLLEQKLKEGKIYVNPHVSVSVAKYRSKKVVVLGEVEKPGVYSINRELTILDVLSMCGGLTDRAGDRLILLRGGSAATSVTSASGKFVRGIGAGQEVRVVSLVDLLQKGNLKENYRVKNGDIIFVPEAGKVYLFGEVKKPGVYKFHEGMTLLQAVVKAGGFTVRAAPSRVRIIRMSGGKEKVIEVNMKKIIDNEEKDVKLKNGDVVVIPESYF